ncbi:MAG: DeoR/GlpR transcriptional regulator [Phaeodactylibacter sp.]|nr:DeoR/GlpR transcriptional regulator [Phaeodactylibacter sp.]
MLKTERQLLILREANVHNKVLQSELSELLKVSEDTIRRDLQELAESGKLQKVRGGAISNSFQMAGTTESEIYAYTEKTTIARKAIQLFQNGMLILISGGTTNLEVARMLPPELKVTFLTVSLPVAMQLARHPDSETLFIGGRISGDAQISTGGEVIKKLLSLKPDLCLLGANSIDPVYGLTDSDWEVVEVKQVMREVSAQTAALAISEKLNTHTKMRICHLSELQYLITERTPDDPFLSSFRIPGLTLL